MDDEDRRIASHLLRMAETRAKARALRDAVNIGVVALEELGELLEEDATYAEATPASANGNGGPRTEAEPSAERKPLPFPSHGDFQPMSDAQRRMLFRLASQRGAKPEEAKAWLEERAGGDLKRVSRADASRLIDQIQHAGAGNGAQPGGAS